MMHHLNTKTYDGGSGKVPENPRVDLWHSLTLHEPHQPMALAAWLNGTPNLTDLEDLTDGEAIAMTERLVNSPLYTLAGWIRYLQGKAEERDGKAWLR
ncbi:hypothetical protein [Deinococcus navajonensis]|uniref:Uncharacterized protein n=1 Tax=Deinococcus navajonensis TaxID=309884 RepID=A0ABV8XLM2_9DEIO